VQPKEARGRKKGERNQEDPGVAASMSGRAGGVGQGGTQRSGGKDEPEMGRMMLPSNVECRPSDQ
jgi:hypothetical protein